MGSAKAEVNAFLWALFMYQQNNIYGFSVRACLQKSSTHKSAWKTNDGTSKRKVQLISLVHILVYDAVKMKEGIEEKEKESLHSGLAQTEPLFVLDKTFWLLLTEMQPLSVLWVTITSVLGKSHEHQSSKAFFNLATASPHWPLRDKAPNSCGILFKMILYRLYIVITRWTFQMVD